MTEVEWLVCRDPYKMTVAKQCRNSRKRRLLACACARRALWFIQDDRFLVAIEASEQYADGLLSDTHRRLARRNALRAYAELSDREFSRSAYLAALSAVRTLEREFGKLMQALDHAQWAQAHLASSDEEGRGPRKGRSQRWSQAQNRALDEERYHQRVFVSEIFGNPFRAVPLDLTLLQWNDGTVRKMAQVIYDDRRFEDMPILADALMDAGCHHPDILTHCRSGGGHVRGCWVLDLLLSKE